MNYLKAAVFLALLVISTGAFAQSYPVMFVSSVWGYPDLGSWPESAGETGATAADAVCQTLATKANLDNPGNYRAWISDSTTDAYCRVLGLAGKKADNCGQPTLPDGGPWLRTDGFPFSPSLQQLTSESMVLVPARYDELGVHYSWTDIAEQTLTGTEEDGTWAIDRDCDGWMQSASGTRVGGQRGKTLRDWTSRRETSCSERGRLLCFEAPATVAPLPFFEKSGAIVFVTSVRRSGHLGAWPEANNKQGLEAGDEICRSLARDAGLSDPNSFVAWLSTSTVDAKDRLATDGPWKRGRRSANR